MHDSTETYSFKTINVVTESSSTEPMHVLLHDLKKYTNYGVIVQSFNRLGPGPKSDEVVARTMEDGITSMKFTIDAIVPSETQSRY